jgi:hypothetical protein
MAMWLKVTGRNASFVYLSIQDLHEKTGIPREVLTGLAYVDEFGYDASVPGAIEDGQLGGHCEDIRGVYQGVRSKLSAGTTKLTLVVDLREEETA